MYALKARAMAVLATAAVMCLSFAAPAALADELATTPTTNATSTVEQSTAGVPNETEQTEDTSVAPQQDEEVSVPASDPSPASAPPQIAEAPLPISVPEPVSEAPAAVSVSLPQPETPKGDSGASVKDKPGTLQPVWCHWTGSGPKAQLGDESSGGRNNTVPLMGDFGWGTTSSGQTLAHDRSNKLDGACESQKPNPEPLVEYGAWQDGAKDCTTYTVTQTRTKTVTPRTAEIQYGSWVIINGTPVVTTESQTREMTTDEVKECTPMPIKDPTTITTWSGDEIADCENGTVTESGTQTVTTYSYTWENGAWVEHASITNSATSRSRDMTDEERQACTTKPEPEDIVTYGAWQDGARDCTTYTVTQTRAVTTIGHTVVWQNGKWVISEKEPVVTTESQTREMTTDEVKECTPPVDLKPATAWVKAGSAATCTNPSTPLFGGEGIEWAEPVMTEPGTYSRTAVTLSGYIFGDSHTMSVSYTIDPPLSGDACPTTPTKPGTNTPSDHTPSGKTTTVAATDRLATTGSDLSIGVLVVGGALLLVGAGALVTSRRLRKQ